MVSLRHRFQGRRCFTIALLAAALFLKILVPTGYMPVVSTRGITIEICTGVMPVSMIMAAGVTKQDHHRNHRDRTVEPCDFAALSMPGLAGADPILLELAIAFVLALGFLPVDLQLVLRAVRLRPPLRGPPSTA